MWLYTDVGWIKAKDILFYGFFNKKDFQDYNSLPKISRYNNLVLFSYPNLPTYKTMNYFEILKSTHKVIK